MKPLARISPSSGSYEEEMGLRPCKGRQVVLIAPPAPLPLGMSPPLVVEPTSATNPASLVGAEVPRGLLPISPIEPLARGLDLVATSSGPLLKLVLEPPEEATYEQPTSPLLVLVVSPLRVEAPCVEPSDKESPPHPQPLAGVGLSGDSLDPT
ncbi:hypothetical protein BHM03_00055316 [Ensete ventricosum]|nr:hypothetical protein BHM03_00055316 [Ensete ventricosum]